MSIPAFLSYNEFGEVYANILAFKVVLSVKNIKY